MSNKDTNAQSRLPRALIRWATAPLSRFLQIEAAAGAVLLIFTVAALALSNSPLAGQFLGLWEMHVGLEVGQWEFRRSLQEWINDGLMTLFFFLVALELKRELVLGDLRRPRAAMLSVSAALGGMLVPAALYLAVLAGEPGQHGWGTVMATDTAFVIGCLALLGKRIPQSLRVFMLSLAIIDDVGAILVVAIGYSTGIAWGALALAVVGIAAVRVMSMLNFRGFPLYFLAGGLIWLAIDASGIHATITGVILGLMTPARRWVDDERLYAILDRVVAHPGSEKGTMHTRDRHTLRAAEIAARETLSPAERLEIALHPWVGFGIMPLFAFANAGVDISLDGFASPVTFAVFIGFVLGKPIGIFLFSWLAIRFKLATRPPGLDWRLIAGGGMLAGIGFTMALFIANLAFGEELMGSVKLGILVASVTSAMAGILLLWLSGVRKREA